MKWTELSDNWCPVARTLSVVGDRWTLLILRDCFLGLSRFEQFIESSG
ncbi:MAG TPA: transcriptional regulator, partial [Hyphomonas adhaerens]|nr:transcriptional regulator [Hyphomonas adhaerens]